jgi:hypothetical protein
MQHMQIIYYYSVCYKNASDGNQKPFNHTLLLDKEQDQHYK